MNKSVKALSDGIPATASSQTPSFSQPKGNKVHELLTNEIMVDISKTKNINGLLN